MKYTPFDFRSQMALYQPNVFHLEFKMANSETVKYIQFIYNFALTISQKLLNTVPNGQDRCAEPCLNSTVISMIQRS